MWARHIFSPACTSFSHVLILKMTHFPLSSDLYCCRCGAKYRQLYEQWEHISAGITLLTGCGGGGGGFSLTDLSLQSHLFFWIISSRATQSPGEPPYAEQTLFFFGHKPQVTLNALSEGIVQYSVWEGLKMRMRRWVGGWCYPALIGAPNLDTLKSLERGRLCGLERVSAPLRCVGIADFKTRWN